MRRLITLVLAGIVGAAAPAAAQSTAKALFSRAQIREQTARKSLEAGRPADAVRKEIAHAIASYQVVVARFPRSAYSDNALWQAAMLSASSYARFRVESDRTDALRLLKRLSTEYPSSSLSRQAKPALARLSGVTSDAYVQRDAGSRSSMSYDRSQRETSIVETV
jgi:hypothetical protein